MGEAKYIYFTCLNCCDFCGSPMSCCTTPSSPTMNITVVHGSSKIPLTLDNLSESTLDDLATQLQEKTGVPKESQKIIFKGKTLSDRSQCLDNLGLKPGAKLMLIGKKFCPEEEAAFRQLDDIKSQAQSLATKLEELEKDFINVSGGFLSKELVADRLDLPGGNAKGNPVAQRAGNEATHLLGRRTARRKFGYGPLGSCQE